MVLTSLFTTTNDVKPATMFSCAFLRRSPILSMFILGMLCACPKPSDGDPPTDAPPTTTSDQHTEAEITATAPKPPFLLLAQAQFDWEEDPATGKRTPKPGPAKLVLLEIDKDAYTPHILEDKESRVFHKAVCQKTQHGVQLLTIGATDAHLKTWTWDGDSWKGTSHWKPTFGGTWDRLRDFELGDVDGDGEKELVIATHDQGVIAVAKAEGNTWKPREIAREPKVFVHEVEIGDVNGDGKMEIYATPSPPNKADHSQSGKIVTYRMGTHGSYESTDVAVFKNRHAKEILVADLDADGSAELYVSVEAKTKKGPGGTQVLEPLEIRRYLPNKTMKSGSPKLSRPYPKGSKRVFS